MKPILYVEGVNKIFGSHKEEALKLSKKGVSKNEILEKTGATCALLDVSLEVNPGETFVIIGLSGSGKSTLVRMFNRLNDPTHGKIFFKNQDLAQLNKEQLRNFRREKIAMVFQHFGLMSHRTVLRNVEYGLEIRGVGPELKKEKAMEMINLVGLTGFENSRIDQLSGGMKQRVGLARALANDPEVLLMDEPFSALDPLVKKDMQFELLKIQQKMKKTIVFITHDINEAFKLGDRVAIMKDGKVIQVDTPENMMANPADEYVTRFIEGADKTAIMSVKHVMITPTTIVFKDDGFNKVIREMRTNNVSSAYVVDDEMKFLGVVGLDSAMRLKDKAATLMDLVEEVETISPNQSVSEILPLASQTRVPLAVVEDGRLIGIVSKASVLTLIANDVVVDHSDEELDSTLA